MICRSAEAEARIDEYARRLFHEFYKKPLDRELQPFCCGDHVHPDVHVDAANFAVNCAES